MRRTRWRRQSPSSSGASTKATSPGRFRTPKKTSFLVSFNRAEDDQDSVVSATLVPTPDDPSGAFNANVYGADARHRVQRCAPRTSSATGISAYVQYSYQDSTAQNQGVGGQSLAAAGYNNQYREDDFVAHRRPGHLGHHAQPDFAGWRARLQPQPATWPRRPQISVAGDFLSGSAQDDSLRHANTTRASTTWSPGRTAATLVKLGAGTPHIDRRAFDDDTNALGTLYLRAHARGRRRNGAADGLAELRRQPALGIHREYRRDALHLSPAGDGRVHPGPVQGERPLPDHARPALRLAEFSGHAAAWLFAARLLRLGAQTSSRRP